MRIRTLKPELLTDEKTAALPDSEWRLFVSCILMADDYGNFRASPAALRAQAFWGTEATLEIVANAREGLARVSLVSLYEVNGQSYGHIVGWSKHQRVDHPGKPYCPGPELGISRPCGESSRKSRESVAKVPEILPTDRERDLERDREGERERISPEKRQADDVPESTQNRTGTIVSKTRQDKTRPDKSPDPPLLLASDPDSKVCAGALPDTAHNLVWAIKAAVESAQPENGMWAPDTFAQENASRLLVGLGDVVKAMPELQRKIGQFAADPDMRPWTVKKFCDAFNGIGKPKAVRAGQPKPMVYR